MTNITLGRTPVGLFLLALASTVTAAQSTASQPLTTEVYVADESAYGVTSTLIYGKTEMILIDAQLRNSDAAKVGDLIQARHRRLTAIFVTHPDLDHYLGLALLHERFPEAKLYMTPKALAEFTRTEADNLASRRKSQPQETPDALPTPEALPHAFLVIEGRHVEMLEDLQGDYPSTPANSALWIASQRILITDDLAFNGVHPWLDDSTEASRAAWRTSIERLVRLNPRTVIAGHKRTANLPDTPDVLTFMNHYLTDFDNLKKQSPDAASFVAAMKEKYPGLARPDFLDYAAKSAYSK